MHPPLGVRVSVNLRVKFKVRVRDMVKRLGLVRVLKSVYGSQLGQPRCHLGFTHAIVYGQATTSIIISLSSV